MHVNYRPLYYDLSLEHDHGVEVLEVQTEVLRSIHRRKAIWNKERRILFFLALPTVLYIILFNYVTLFGWYIAFVDYVPGLPIFKQQFVGFHNFSMIFRGATDLGQALVNTLAISAIGLFCIPIPAIFAILLTQCRNSFSRVVQTLTSLPNFVSWVLVYSIVFVFFSSIDGIANKFLMDIGFINEPLNVLGNEKYAWYIQTLLGIIKGTGWGAIIFIAALTSIDTQLFDAADVDGASRFQKIIHISVPGIMPTFFVIFLFTIAGIFNSGFDQYYVFQNTMTISKLEVLDTYTYRIGLLRGDFPLSTAIGMFKSLVGLTLLFVANHVSKIVRGDSII